MTTATTLWRSFIGLASTALLALATWQTTTVVSLVKDMAGLKVKVTGIDSQQGLLTNAQDSSRARGDALRQSVADVRQSVAVVQTQVATVGTKIDTIDNKLDRLIERRFGTAVPPTTGSAIVPVVEGQPWQAQ